jgi:agmatine deiminase
MTRHPIVYVADTLPARYPGVWSAMQAALASASVATVALPGTRDVWVRDYMPAVLPSGGLVQFCYAPDYLRTKRGQRSITDTARICAAHGWQPHPSNLVVDGGNLVRCGNRVLLTDKVLRENAALEPRQLVRQLTQQLEAESLVLLPTDPHDFTGHADGMLHVLDERTVLLNDCRREKLWPTLQTTLLNAGLNWIFLPYNPYDNATYKGGRTKD